MDATLPPSPTRPPIPMSLEYPPTICCSLALLPLQVSQNCTLPDGAVSVGVGVYNATSPSFSIGAGNLIRSICPYDPSGTAPGSAEELWYKATKEAGARGWGQGLHVSAEGKEILSACDVVKDNPEAHASATLCFSR